MTMQIPLSLVTSQAKADDNSPIVWDGSDLVVSQAGLNNIFRLRTDLNSLGAKQAGYATEIDRINSAADAIDSLINTTQTEHKFATVAIERASRETATLTGDFAFVDSELAKVEAHRSSDVEVLAEAEKIANLIKSGQFFKLSMTNSENLAITKNKLGEYILADYAIESINFLPGKNVSLTYNTNTSSYALSFDYPSVSNLIRSGDGVNVDTNSSGLTTVGILDALFSTNSGIEVGYSGSAGYLYTLKLANTFVQGDVTGVVARRVGDNFSLKLSDDLLKKIRSSYTFSGGLSYDGSRVKVDNNVMPELVSGAGAKVTKTTTTAGKTTYSIAFDLSTSSVAKQPIYAAQYPLILDKKVTNNVTSELSFALAPEWVQGGGYTADLLTQTETYLQNVTSKLNSPKTWGDFPLNTRRALGCPMLKLFRLATGKVENSNLLQAGSSAAALDLFNTMGPGKQDVPLNLDVLPYLTLSNNVGSSPTLDTSVRLDLFVTLETHLRKLTGNPLFVISPEERNTKYKVKKVTSPTYIKRYNPELYAPYYNMELDASKFADTQFRVDHLVECMALEFDADYNSTTYSGKPLKVTGGDCDFIAGVVRQNQTNITQLVMPATLSHATLIKLKTVVVTNQANGVQYDLTVTDGYNADTEYTASFLRTNTVSMNPNLDYIKEIAGDTNPGHIRAFSRLYANWQYNDRDLNVLVHLLGAGDNCMARGVGEHFYADFLRGSSAYYYSPRYLQEIVEETTQYDVSLVTDLDTGIANLNVSATVPSASTAPMELSIESVMREIRIPIIYEINANTGLSFSSDRLFESCCWGTIS